MLEFYSQFTKIVNKTLTKHKSNILNEEKN